MAGQDVHDFDAKARSGLVSARIHLLDDEMQGEAEERSSPSADQG
jgi:hypothetical protein